MAFNDIEISEFGNAPIELYTFSRGSITWRMNSSDEDVTFQGSVYPAIPLRRGRIESTQDLGKTNLRITMTRRASFVNQFIATSPTDIVSVTITRIHNGETDQAITWRGRVVNVKFLQNEAEVTCQPIYSSLRRPGLRRLYQLTCPHVLYGSECRVERTGFAVAATLTTVNGNEITAPEFIISIDPTLNADWFVGGYVEFNNGGLIDRRFIREHNNVTGTLSLNLSFPDLVSGNAVTAYPGCTHTTGVCASKFSNILNYGGFPFIPTKNPMDGTPVF